jgi:CRISPR/Cas system endoribonuclease Cas6 (RAMP superfamily)
MDYKSKKGFAQKREQVTITTFVDGKQIINKLPLKDVELSININGEIVDATLEQVINKLDSKLKVEQMRVDNLITDYQKKLNILVREIEKIQLYLKERGKVL